MHVGLVEGLMRPSAALSAPPAVEDPGWQHSSAPCNDRYKKCVHWYSQVYLCTSGAPMCIAEHEKHAKYIGCSAGIQQGGAVPAPHFKRVGPCKSAAAALHHCA